VDIKCDKRIIRRNEESFEFVTNFPDEIAEMFEELFYLVLSIFG
jgi:hypothetical protein